MALIALQHHPRVASRGTPEARARSVRRRVGVAWALLFFNTLTYFPSGLLHIPSHIGKGLTNAALPLALLVALTVNPRIRLRPNVFLCLLGLLVVDTVITGADFTISSPGHVGTAYRTLRLIEYVAALWLLTPWWGRDDMLLLRYHLRCLYAALGSVLLGLLIAPGRAFNGRLVGVIWPMAPTQVAQYAGVAAGVTVLLWLGRRVTGRVALAGATFAIAMLLLTHSRTELLGLLLGLVVAGLSLFTINARVRKFFAAGAAAVVIGVVTLSDVVTSWLTRGQNAQGLASLSGRTNFWALVLIEPRTRFQEIFGFGLSNASINGLPIDSNWFASYQQEGIFGTVVCAMMLVWLIVTAFFQPRGTRRAIALFLVTFCTVASFTEDAFSDVSTYLLHLVVAASLLIAPLYVYASDDSRADSASLQVPGD